MYDKYTFWPWAKSRAPRAVTMRRWWLSSIGKVLSFKIGGRRFDPARTRFLRLPSQTASTARVVFNACLTPVSSLIRKLKFNGVLPLVLDGPFFDGRMAGRPAAHVMLFLPYIAKFTERRKRR